MAKPDLLAELKQLKLHGMAQGYAELIQENGSALDGSHWLIEHLVRAENTDRGMRSIRHQLHSARFPIHRDLAGFDFAACNVDLAVIVGVGWLVFWVGGVLLVFLVFFLLFLVLIVVFFLIVV